MSTSGIPPAIPARPSAVSQFIHPVKEKASTLRWIFGRSSTPRSRGGIGARISCSLAALTIVFWMFCSAPALAQNDVGSIVGFVTDPTGAAVPGATVTATNEGTGEKRTVTSDAAGHYALPNLVPAPYTLSVEAKGFQKFESTHDTLASNSTIDIDAKLVVGQESQTVEVTATAALLQTQSAAVQSEVTGDQVQKMELNGRNP